MKIAFFEIRPGEKEFFQTKLSAHELYFSGEPINLATLPQKDFEVISTHTNSKIDKSTIETLPNLKLIATRTTGYDHIDITSATAKGIIVCNVPTYGEVTVAEYTFALILSLARRIPIAYNRVRSGEFHTDGLEGFDLNGKTIGIVGTGHIGVNVIKIARGFGMKVIAFDAFPNQNLQADLGFTYATLDDLYKQSDIITFHVPGLPQTTHMLNMSHLDTLKKGIYIINTSRGSVVETAALVQGLDKEIIAGVAIDVMEEETHLIENAEATLENHLINHPNVIVTPHNAFNTVEAKQRITETTLANIENFLKGTPTNIVKPHKD